MTAAELKIYIANQLSIPVNEVAKVINALYSIVDFASAINTDLIPDWSSAKTFKLNGTGNGRYCKYPDDKGKKRIFETKTDDNKNNPPPVNSSVTQNDFWLEISASESASIPEWSAGLYGSGLIIVYHNHSVDGEGLYLLSHAARPYSSVNIETEIAANEWIRLNKSLPSSVWVDQGEWNPQEDPIPLASKKNYTWDIVLTDPDNPPEIGGKMLTPGATIRSMKPGANDITDFKVYY